MDYLSSKKLRHRSAQSTARPSLIVGSPRPPGDPEWDSTHMYAWAGNHQGESNEPVIWGRIDGMTPDTKDKMTFVFNLRGRLLRMNMFAFQIDVGRCQRRCSK
jgi:hypothetical protein